MPSINNITVYCSSSSAVDPIYFDHAIELGKLIGESGFGLVYGGTNVGLMGAVAGAVRNAGGKTIGVIPEAIAAKGISNPDDEEQFLVSDMRTRKGKMDDLGDAFIALPGGFGTLEELFEVITSKQLSYHKKPIVLINTANYFDKLMEFVEHSMNQKFVKPEMSQLYFLAATPQEAIDHIKTYQPKSLPTKWS
jgi:cytokinin riboside 5'-monophosphate phosphoribohydrolase